jgi:GNAT superfamily N-acetyltransferase
MNMTAKPSDQTPITVVPATSERWSDIQELFTQTPCWCQYWRVSASEYGRTSNGQMSKRFAARSNALRTQLEHSTPPGVIAYINGQIVGWCGFGLRHEMERLVRSRTIPAVDNLPVCAIVFFLVLPGYRRRVVERALLRGASECARSHEHLRSGIPIDPASRRINTASAYVGTLSMFEQEGFRRVIETSARSGGLPRWLMRLELST